MPDLLAGHPDWLVNLTPSGLRPYVPESNFHRALLGLSTLGGLGLAYNQLVPLLDSPEDILPPSRLRVALRKKKEEEERPKMGKYSSAFLKESNRDMG